MDREWVKEVDGMSVKEQWETLYDRKKKITEDGKSVWGRGNVYRNSAKLSELLPELLNHLKIKSFVDIGCGDFIWLSRLDWSGIKYTGIDIVKELIEVNKDNYPKHNFKYGNLIESKCPKADIVFIRSVFIHTSLGDCKNIIDNIKKSKSKYLMASTLPYLEENRETSHIWVVQRNLQIEPFNFPEPEFLLPELKREDGEVNNYMGVWRIEDIN